MQERMSIRSTKVPRRRPPAPRHHVTPMDLRPVSGELVVRVADEVPRGKNSRGWKALLPGWAIPRTISEGRAEFRENNETLLRDEFQSR